MGTFIFDLVKGKTKFLYAIIFIFSFKQTKEQILFLAKLYFGFGTQNRF